MGPDWKYLDLEKPTDYQIVANNPVAFFQDNPHRIIIDEAQEYPQIFKVLRGVIDEQRDLNGRFIVTDSSSPELIEHLSDSLAGRVGILHVRSLKANEYYKKPLSSFYNIFKSGLEQIPQPQMTNKEMRHCWLYGGYPEPLLKDDSQFFLDWMSNYQSTYINRDIAKLFPKLNKRAYQRFLSILSSLSGNVINKSDLARSIEVSEGSIREYLQIEEQTFIWRNINSLAHSKVKSLVKRPKGYITDSGLLHYLQGIDSLDKLLVSLQVGRSFESYVIEEIIKGLESISIGNIDYSYYRTQKGSEIDLIIDCPFGRIPIEIKMAATVSPGKLKALKTYIDENDLEFGLLINQSEHATWITDKILQLPIGVL